MDQLGADKAFVVAYPDQDLLVSKCFKTSSKLKTAKDRQNGDKEEKEVAASPPAVLCAAADSSTLWPQDRLSRRQ